MGEGAELQPRLFGARDHAVITTVAYSDRRLRITPCGARTYHVWAPGPGLLGTLAGLHTRACLVTAGWEDGLAKEPTVVTRVPLRPCQ